MTPEKKRIFRRFEILNIPIDGTYDINDPWDPVKTHDFETEEDAKDWTNAIEKQPFGFP